MKLDLISRLYSIFKQYPIICTDSRTCPMDSLFFALKGDNFNANAFALSALEKGCRYAIIDEAEYKIDDRFILVDDVLKTLQKLATFHRQQLSMPIIAITGTNGKTTTKELIAIVLKEKYNVLYTQGNLNNHIGVPLTLLKLKHEHEIAVVEMGANHLGEIKQLCEIARPDYGIITNVGKAHLEGFGSFEGIKKTKAELYDYIVRNGKLIFINPNNEDLCEMAKNAGVDNKIVKYIDGKIVNSSPFLEMELFHSPQEAGLVVRSNLIGVYNAENILASATIAHYFAVSNEQIKHGLENYIPQNNRSQFIETEKNKLIVDAYNANPSSMALAIKNFAQVDAASKFLILGDMLELGGQSEQEHQNIVDLLQENKFDNVFFVGKEFAKTNNSYRNFENTADLSEYIENEQIKNQYILIKGSRGIKLEQTIEKL